MLVRLGERNRAGELLEQDAAGFGERGMDQELLVAQQELASLRAGEAI